MRWPLGRRARDGGEQGGGGGTENAIHLPSPVLSLPLIPSHSHNHLHWESFATLLPLLVLPPSSSALNHTLSHVLTHEHTHKHKHTLSPSRSGRPPKGPPEVAAVRWVHDRDEEAPGLPQGQEAGQGLTELGGVLNVCALCACSV